MGSEVVVTYRRKRLFSRSNHSYTKLHSDTPSEISKSKTEDFRKHAVEENILQNKDPEIGICHRYLKDKDDEEALQCENCDPHYCSQYSKKHAVKLELPEQQDSSVSNQTQKLTPEPMKLSLKCDVKQNAFNPNVILDGQIDSASQSNGEGPSKSGAECEEKCKEALSKEPDLFRLEASDGITCSDQIKGSSISGEEINKLKQDQHSSLCNNSLAKRKFPSTLITYCRRSKQSRGVAAPATASESETLPASRCLVDLNDGKVQLTNSFTDSEEKKPPVDIDKACCFSVPASATAMVIHTKNPPNGEPKNTQTAAADDTCEEMPLRETVVRDYHHIDVGPQSLSSNDVSIVSEKRDSQFSLDLSISSRGSRDIDSNRPLDCGSDKNYMLKPAGILHDSVGSTSKLEGKTPTLQVDKGKNVLDPQPVLTGTSSKNCCLQLFPEKPEKLSQFQPSTLYPPNFHSLPRQIVGNRAFDAPSYQRLPNIQAQPRESFHNFLQSTAVQTQSFSTQNILSRARAVMGKKSSFLDQFNYPSSTWSEDELDSLWIGVRRHGRGNWDGILRDRRLHFSPWRTTQDLAEKWQGEQSMIFCNTPISQLNFVNNKENRQLKRTCANTVPLSSYSYLTNGWWGGLHPPLGDEFSSNKGPMKGGLPHWLRAAVVAPPRPFDPNQIVGSSVCHSRWCGQPGFECWQLRSNSRYASAQTRAEPHSAAVRCGKTQSNEHLDKEDELIIIPGDASSEETISDDHSIRP